MPRHTGKDVPKHRLREAREACRWSQRDIEAVKKWFASHQQWLLILDNADDIAIVPGFLPMKQAGHLLITTRAQALGALA